MKIKTKERRQNGNVLLMALFVGVALSLVLITHLTMISNERAMTARSQTWNAAIPVAEAGVEEALTELYYVGTNNFGSVVGGGTNGWLLGADGRYHKNRSLTSSSYYGTAIQLAAFPIIWSTGSVSAPIAGTNAYISRLVKVVTVHVSGFVAGLLAKSSISISGGGGVDSYNGCNGPYTPITATSNAVVVTNSTNSPAIKLTGQSFIHGNATTGPSGTVAGSPFVSGTIGHDANVQINDVAPPSFGAFSVTLPGGKVNGTNYTYVAGTGNYKLSSLGIAAGQSMVVNGNAVIYTTSTANNSVLISGSGFIYIAPGGSLTLYVAGPATISGGGVVNGTQSASACYIYGLPTCTAMTYSGSANFIGVVDTPEADFTFSGTESAFGSFTAKTVNISGSGGVHIDTCLGGSGQGYVVQSWNELPTQ